MVNCCKIAITLIDGDFERYGLVTSIIKTVMAKSSLRRKTLVSLLMVATFASAIQRVFAVIGF
jgi:hypothetical protein